MDDGLHGIGSQVFSDLADSVQVEVRCFTDVGDMDRQGHGRVQGNTQILCSMRGVDLISTNSNGGRRVCSEGIAREKKDVRLVIIQLQFIVLHPVMDFTDARF